MVFIKGSDGIARSLKENKDVTYRYADSDVATFLPTNTANIGGANINSGNLIATGQVVSTGNVSGGNVTTAGAVEATGLITSGTTITATGNVAGGNITTAGDVTTVTVTASGAIAGSTTITATGNVVGGNVTTAGQIQADNVDSTNAIVGGTTITATGNVAGGNITTAGAMEATGNITGGNLTTAGNVVFSDSTQQSTSVKTSVVRAVRIAGGQDASPDNWTITTLSGTAVGSFVTNGTTIGLNSNAFVVITFTGYTVFPTLRFWNGATAPSNDPNAIESVYEPGVTYAFPNISTTNPFSAFDPTSNKIAKQAATTAAKEWYFQIIGQ